MACPCLKQKKGSLAGATLNGKIFAIGGGDESRSFSEVEMFDPVLGSWIYSPSMQQCVWSHAPSNAHIQWNVLNLICNLNYWLFSFVICDQG